jgi:glutamine synthetase
MISMIPRIDTETGPGVFETALAYTTALRVADNALLFKYLVKSLGMKYGITPSFMAKPWGNVRYPFLWLFAFLMRL